MCVRPLVFLICLAFSAVLAVTPASAQGVLYDCDIHKTTENGWVSPKMAIVLDGKGGATVIDGVILNFVEKPIPAKLRVRGSKYIVTWTIRGMRDSELVEAPRFDYTAKIDSNRNSVTVTANPVDFPQRWSFNGQCKTRLAKK